MRLPIVLGLTVLVATAGSATAGPQLSPETSPSRETVGAKGGSAVCRLGRLVGTLRDAIQRKLCQSVNKGARRANLALGGVASALRRMAGGGAARLSEAEAPSSRLVRLGSGAAASGTSSALSARLARLGYRAQAKGTAEAAPTSSSGLGRLMQRFVAKGGHTLNDLKERVLDLRDKLDKAKEHLPSMWELEQKLTHPDAKKWTVFVYMNADNNLHQAGLKDLQEMAKVGSNKDMNVVVLWDGSKTEGSGEEARSKLLYVEKGKIKELKSLDELNMGNPETLATGVVTAMKQFPAERTALVVWDHGLGWQGISFDDEPECAMSLPGLSGALKSAEKQIGRKFDVLGWDACLMNMTEVNYETRKLAKYAVGSEQTTPGDGWDYKALLGALARKPTMDGKEFACAAVDTFAKSYDNGSQGKESVCASAIDLGSLDRSFRRFNDFARALKEEAARGVVAQNGIRRAAHCAQRFEEASYMDLVGFTKQLSSTTDSAEVKKYSDRLASFLQEEVIVRNATVGPEYQNANGMSIYFPNDASAFGRERPLYNELSMSQDSCWRDLLDICVTRGRQVKMR